MKCFRLAATALLVLSSTAFAQVSGLTIASYQLVEEQVISATSVRRSYRANLTNSGPAFSQVTATVSSNDPFSIRVTPGQDSLTFSSVPAGGQATSGNTFSILVTNTAAFSFSNLQWTFKTSGGPMANAGPNQTATVGSVVTLNGSGSLNPSGVGSLSYNWSFVSLPQGSNAFIARSSAAIASMIVDVAGTYVIALTVSNGLDSNIATTTVTTSGGQVAAPTANAGTSQSLTVGATAILDGSRSTSTAGNSLTYSWAFVSRPSGSAAALTGPTTVAPRFVVDVAGSYVIQLIVNDGQASAPATVTITGVAVTPQPTANAGPNQSVTVGALVQLTGAGSVNPGGTALTYSWSFNSVPAGSTATLTNSSTVSPTFVADRAGTYVVRLIVNNGTASAPATVTITAQTQQLPPTANAGPNQTVSVGAVVQLTGAGSVNPNGTSLTYSWSFTSVPAGSTATLTNSSAVNPTFVADRAGTYVVRLIVNNGTPSPAATVTITAQSQQLPPTANAGPNQSVSAGASVTLNGSGTDPQNLPLTYQWSLLSKPSFSTATLSSANTAHPAFVADMAGTYVAQLIISNGTLSSTPSTVTVTASGASAILLPANMTVPAGQSAPFPISLAAPAPSGGVFLTVGSSDTSKLTISPSAILINEGLQSATRPPTVTGIAGGSATVTAQAFGMPVATATVQVGSGSSGGSGGSGTTPTSLSLSPSSIIINGLSSQSLTLTLNAPAPTTGLVVLLSSSNPSVVTVPITVSFGANATTASALVTPLNPGSSTITANASGLPSANASVTVASQSPTPTVTVPVSSTVGSGQSVDWPVSLSAPAPSGGVFISLASSDTSKASVTSSVLIPAGLTTPSSQPKVTGNALGGASITASAYGYTAASGQVQVVATSGFSYFLPANIVLTIGENQVITLNTSTFAPAGVTAVLTSSNPAIFTVPATLPLLPGGTIFNLTVTGVASGSATLTAVVPGFGSTTIPVTVVPNSSNVSVIWEAACWQPATIYGITGNFQSMAFTLSAPAPVTVNATLFFTADCSAGNGQDNMNDYGSLTTSGRRQQGFTHFPDVIPSSALFWVGPRTSDGRCPPGAPCSGCVKFNQSTPSCYNIP